MAQAERASRACFIASDTSIEAPLEPARGAQGALRAALAVLRSRDRLALVDVSQDNARGWSPLTPSSCNSEVDARMLDAERRAAVRDGLADWQRAVALFSDAATGLPPTRPKGDANRVLPHRKTMRSDSRTSRS
jgi:hypothetical protein